MFGGMFSCGYPSRRPGGGRKPTSRAGRLSHQPAAEREPLPRLHTIHFLLMFRRLTRNKNTQKAARAAKSSHGGSRPAPRIASCRTSAP